PRSEVKAARLWIRLQLRLKSTAQRRGFTIAERAANCFGSGNTRRAAAADEPPAGLDVRSRPMNRESFPIFSITRRERRFAGAVKETKDNPSAPMNRR